MSKYLDASIQCTLHTDSNISEHNHEEYKTPVLYSDDKETRTLSSLLNTFGIKYNRVSRSTTDSTSSRDYSSPISRGRVLPIDTDLPLSNNIANISIGRTSITDSSLSEYTLMPWQNYDIETPTTPKSYEHPWL